MSLDIEIARFLDKWPVQWENHAIVTHTIDDLYPAILAVLYREPVYWCVAAMRILPRIEGDPQKFIAWLQDDSTRLDRYVASEADRNAVVVEYCKEESKRGE